MKALLFGVALAALPYAANAASPFREAANFCTIEVESYDPGFSAYMLNERQRLVETVGSARSRYAFFRCLDTLGYPMVLGPVRY